MNQAGLLIQEWPGGIWTASGGTRTAVKLNRPWQTDIMVDPNTCPFCTKPQTVLKECGNWLVLENAFTPFPFHQLVIPKECWPVTMIRNLGGEENLSDALRIVWRIIEQQGRDQMLHSVFSGYLAGQNVPHLHHHVLENTFPGFVSRDVSKEVIETAGDPARILFEEGGFRVTVGGLRAGQCYIVPTESELTANPAIRISKVLIRIIDLYADKFRSDRGLPPDYQVALRFRGGKLAYGFYLPVLNHWGATEYLGVTGEQPVILPWPHEETVRHLLS